MITTFGKKAKAAQKQQEEPQQATDVTPSSTEQSSGVVSQAEKKSFKKKAPVQPAQQQQQPTAAPTVQPEKKSFNKQKATAPTPQPQVAQQQQPQQQPQQQEVVQQQQQSTTVIQHKPIPYNPSTLPTPITINNNRDYEQLYQHFAQDPAYIIVHVFSRRVTEAAAHVSIELPGAKFIEKHDVSVQYGRQPRLLAELFTLELALRLVIGLKQSAGLHNHKVAVFSSYNQGLQQFLLPVDEKSEFLTENASRVPDYAAYADMLQNAGMAHHVDFAVLNNELARDPTSLTGSFIEAFKNVLELDSQPAPTEGDDLKYGFIRANKKAYINRP
eukprot:UN04777